MPDKQHDNQTKGESVKDADTSATQSELQRPKEIGGRKDGLDPTRYGDWEKAGRCIDF